LSENKWVQFRGIGVRAMGVLLLAVAVLTPTVLGQANVQGTWQTLPTLMPINPIHTALLKTGKILVVSGSGNYPPETTFSVGVWDPSTNTFTNGPSQSWDMFCNGMIVLPDGRPFIVGGNLQYDPFHGWQRTTAFDPATGKYSDMEDMAHGRWYPTTTVLGDGRVMTFSGLDENGNTNSQVEIYKVGIGWGVPVSSWTPPLYPRLHLLPNGKVFYSGATPQSRLFDPAVNSWSNVMAYTNYGRDRTYGSSVLLPLTPANGYKPKVMIFGGGNPATATTEIIDLSATTPTWVYGRPMSQPRVEMNATLLPNGKVLTLGGSLNDEDITTQSLQADLYDPSTDTMASAGSGAYARLYHSVSLLLPDGTVWVAGGNPNRGSYEQHVEIYSPPYLFDSTGAPAARPSITGVSDSVIGYGTSFQIQTLDAANIASVVLMKNGAVTHAFDMDQRLVGLNFTAGSSVLNVTGPPNGNIAPPGYYMLFLINTAGVPSIAKFVQISTQPTDVPPTASITLPATDQSIGAGQSVTFAGTGTASGGRTITGYSWSIRGATPATSQLQNPGMITFSKIGRYTAVLTVTDDLGITSPSPATRTVVVNAVLPTPTLTSLTPSSAAQGMTNLNVTLAGTHFVTGATCSLGSGVAVNSCTVNSGTQITANVSVPANAAAGADDVTITNPDGQVAELAGGFSITQAAPAVTISQVSVTFPNTTQNVTSAPITVTVKNTGNATLNVTTVALAGTNASDFAQTNTCSAPLAANATCAINVTFTPASTAVRQGTLQISDNASGSPQSVALSGTGIAPAVPVVSISPASVTFPNTTQNVTSAPITVTVKNTGNATLNITTVALAGTNASDFAQTNTCSAPLAANATCAINVTFTPASAAVRQGTLQISDNASGSPQSVALSGTGIAPAVPVVSISPASLTFPNTTQNTTSAPITVTVKNTGNATLNITTVALAGTNASDFAQTNTCSAPLAANATCAINVTFTPASAAVRQGTLQISDNASGSPQSVALSGTGIAQTAAPAVTITPSTVSLAATQGTISSPMNVEVTNSGNAPLHISSVAYGGANASEFINPTNPCATTIAANASCSIAVSFAPLAASGNRTDTITIADDAANSPQVITVTGTARPAFAVTSPSTALAATITAGQTATYSLQLTPGAGYSGNVTMACSGAPAGAACTATPNPIPLAAGSATNFTVRVATTARSLVPYSNRGPSLPSAPYLMIIWMGMCFMAILALYQVKARGRLTQHQFAHYSFLVLALAASGLAGCASAGTPAVTSQVQAGTLRGTYTLMLTPTATSMTGQPVQPPSVQLTLTVN